MGNELRITETDSKKYGFRIWATFMRFQDGDYCWGGTLYSVRDALRVARFLPALKEVSAIFLISGINLHYYKIHLK